MELLFSFSLSGRLEWDSVLADSLPVLVVFSVLDTLRLQRVQNVLTVSLLWSSSTSCSLVSSTTPS